MFFVGLTILSGFAIANSWSCISMSNQECKTRPQLVNVNGDEPVFYPFNIEISECSGSCNGINYLYAKICVPDVAKNLNVKVFNLTSGTNGKRHIEWHETCKCECKFGVNACNNKQRRNKDQCKCECKELVDKGVCDKGFIWNPSNYSCGCDKACDVGEYLEYENCKGRKKIVDKLVDECTESVDKVKLAKITLTGNESSYKFSSWTVYIVLFSIFFAINVAIVTYYVYSQRYTKKDTRTQATIYWTYQWEKSNKLILKMESVIFITIKLI